MKKYLSVIVCISIFLCLFLSGCGYTYAELEQEGEYSRDLEGTTLTVYNWGEYISDGSDDSIDVNREFEKVTGIKVNYLTFESNETMYSQIENGGVNYDVVIPSDYMIERMIKEDMLAEIDTAKLSNYGLIDEKYKNIFFDPAKSSTDFEKHIKNSDKFVGFYKNIKRNKPLFNLIRVIK